VVVLGGVGNKVQNCEHLSSKVDFSSFVVASVRGGMALVWVGVVADMIFHIEVGSALFSVVEVCKSL
jgi:hypothetical protein